MRRTLVGVAAILLIGCSQSPTSPAPTPTPAPEVTLSVSGWVRDTIDRLLPGVRVEVITGRLAGTFVTTNDNGEFAFAEPVPVSSQIKASKPGYLDAIATLTAGTQSPLMFLLNSANPPIIFTGQFDITFEADSTCTALSEAARKRTYQASLRAVTELSGATFLGGDPPFNVIQLSQAADHVKFALHDPPVWELIPDGSHVQISGEALGQVDQDFSLLELTMHGEFRYCPSFSAAGPSLCSVATVSCASSRHVITVRRR